MSETSAQDTDDVSDPTEYASIRGLGWGEIVANCSVGDRVHLRFPSKEGSVDWRSYWVHDAGDEYVDCGKWRLEIVDDPEVARGQVGDRGVRMLQHDALGYIFLDFHSLGGIERVPREAFDGRAWNKWEIGTTLGRGEELPSDQTVVTEAPSRDVAIEKALRWTDRESSGSPTVVYQEEEIESPSDRCLAQKRRDRKFEQNTRVCELCSEQVPGGVEKMLEHIEDEHSLEDLAKQASFSWTPSDPKGLHLPNETIHFVESNTGLCASTFCGQSYSGDDFEDVDVDWSEMFSYDLGNPEDYCGNCVQQMKQDGRALYLPPVLEEDSR